MSHAYSDIVSIVLSGIDAEYGNIVEMTITQVEIKKYLGIIINYSSTGKSIISMVGYIGNVLDDITEDMKRESVTPNPHNIFDITKYATKLSWTDAEIFIILCYIYCICQSERTQTYSS